MVAYDFHFLDVGVAVNGDDFQTITQRTWDGFERVRRSDKHHIGKVKIYFEIMIAERVVLCWVKHFQQRRRGIATPARCQLVDLIKQNYWVHGFGFAKRTYNSS